MIRLAYLWGSCRRAGAGTSADEFVFQHITESQLSGQRAGDSPACARELPDGDTAGYLHGHPLVPGGGVLAAGGRLRRPPRGSASVTYSRTRHLDMNWQIA
jgi:hypothetical protein